MRIDVNIGSAAKTVKKKPPEGDLKALFKGKETARIIFYLLGFSRIKLLKKGFFAALHHRQLKRIRYGVKRIEGL
jgi:hypothetical protein